MPEKPAPRRVIFPSSIGLSVLVPAAVASIEAVVTWGDYAPDEAAAAEAGGGDGAPVAAPPVRDQLWTRTPQSQSVHVPIPAAGGRSRAVDVPGSGGLRLYASVRHTAGGTIGLPAGTRAVALFLVNERQAAADDHKDRAFVFQAAMELRCEPGFVPRPDPRRGTDDDWDDRVADLQYADVFEYATGHGVSADWEASARRCTRVWTTWTPCATVPFVEPAHLPAAMLGMEALASASAEELVRGLTPLPREYGEWIDVQRTKLPDDPQRRMTASDLLSRATAAHERIEKGIAALATPHLTGGRDVR